MNHDIAHCNNEDCPAKVRCHRYQAHLDVAKRGLMNISYIYIEPEIRKDDGTCVAFWEEH